MVYLVVNADYQTVKVGVTTTLARKNRIATHHRESWQLVQTWDVSTGGDAYDIEQTILRWWRDGLGAPPAMQKADMPQGGWTETASLLWVDVDDTVARIQAEVDRLRSEPL